MYVLYIEGKKVCFWKKKGKKEEFIFYDNKNNERGKMNEMKNIISVWIIVHDFSFFYFSFYSWYNMTIFFFLKKSI